MSNATNANSLRLSISGKILSIINFPKSLVLQPDQSGKVEKILALSTEKRNLQILDMSFDKSKSTTPAWQAGPPFGIEYSLTRSDTADIDGYFSYSLDYSFSYAPEKTASGYFYLNTNHQKVETLKIRAIIKPVQKQKTKKE